MINNDCEFFWRGPLSQWYLSDFIVDGIRYNTAEQYMMYMKAVIFHDKETARKILNTKSPKIQKLLGRQVKNFHVDKWNNKACSVVYKGNYAKFTQNEDLYNYLLSTAPKLLVEASPVDLIWGIGLDEETAIVTPKNQWKGKNWLGKTLTNLRNDLLTKRNN